jgi:hypothetical protein
LQIKKIKGPITLTRPDKMGCGVGLSSPVALGLCFFKKKLKKLMIFLCLFSKKNFIYI